MKLTTNANHVKVPLTALRITGNVRKNFDPEDIERLALSIRQDGLMNPITVRPPVEDEHGNKIYEVIAGGRRIRAHQWLCDHGDDFAMIECCIRTGDTWTLQMIENIQRTDLSPREKEEAVAEAMANGLTQTQIAEKLCKPISYVSDIVAGMKVREAADEAGIATDEISTKALSQLRSIPEESLGDALTELAESGGTFREATRVMREYKKPVIEDESNAYDNTTNVSSTAEDEATDPFDIEPESTEKELPTPGTIVKHIGRRLFFDELYVGMLFVHGDENSAQYGKICKIVEKADDYINYIDDTMAADGTSPTLFSTRRKYIDSQKQTHTDDWIYSIPDYAIAQFHQYQPQKKPDFFNWYIKDESAMQDALLALPQKLKKMPLKTEICVQAGSKTAPITSVIYNPDEDRLIFRCLEDFGVRF